MRKLRLRKTPDRFLPPEFNRKLKKLQAELESGRRDPKHESPYTKYFEVSETPKRGIKVAAKNSVIEKTRKNYGYFVLLSNDVKDPVEALKIYRNKDLVEKAFGNLKERLNMKRLAVSSELSLDGKLFVEFIALIFLSHIKKQMQDTELFKKFTMRELLDELEIIECFEAPGYKLEVGEMTKRQQELFKKIGVVPPSLQ